MGTEMKNPFSSLCTSSHPEFHSSSNISGQLVPFFSLHPFYFFSHFSGIQNVAPSPFLVKDFLLSNIFSILASAGRGSTGQPLILQQGEALAPLLPGGSEHPIQLSCFRCNQHLSGTCRPSVCSEQRMLSTLEEKLREKGKCIYRNVMRGKKRMNQQ